MIDLMVAGGHAAAAARPSASSPPPPASAGSRTSPRSTSTSTSRDFDEASQWAVDHGKADYLWSKLAINAYVAREAMRLLKQGIRINAILPGPTNTPLAQANADTWLTFGADYREEVGHRGRPPRSSRPTRSCSSAATRPPAITGVTLVTDAGYFAAGMSGAFQPAGDAVGFFRSEF